MEPARDSRGQVQDEQETAGELFTTQNARRFPEITKKERLQCRPLSHRVDKHVPREGNEVAAASEHEQDARRDEGKGGNGLRGGLDADDERREICVENVEVNGQQQCKARKRRPTGHQRGQNTKLLEGLEVDYGQGPGGRARWWWVGLAGFRQRGGWWHLLQVVGGTTGWSAGPAAGVGLLRGHGLVWLQEGGRLLAGPVEGGRGMRVKRRWNESLVG